MALNASESVHSPNPFVNLFGPSGAKLATWQAVVVAGVFELCFVFCAVMFEMLVHSSRKEPEAMQAQLVEPEPASPPAPRLVASESRPVGNVAAIIGKLMETAKGERIEIEDAYEPITPPASHRGNGRFTRRSRNRPATLLQCQEDHHDRRRKRNLPAEQATGLIFSH